MKTYPLFIMASSCLASWYLLFTNFGVFPSVNFWLQMLIVLFSVVGFFMSIMPVAKIIHIKATELAERDQSINYHSRRAIAEKLQKRMSIPLFILCAPIVLAIATSLGEN